MIDFIFHSSLPVSYYDALERLLFFNPRQRHAEAAITHAVELYGTPEIVDDASGLRVVVSKRADAQCLFVLAPGRRGLDLAGMAIYLRVSSEEMAVLHMGVAARYGRSRRSSLEVVIALLRAVRAAAHRLRGVERLTMVYLEGRRFRIALKSGVGLSEA